MSQMTLEEIKAWVESGSHRVAQPAPTGNPCVSIYGQGKPGQTCKGCDHLRALIYAKTYYKCDLRQNTHGTKTDHKVRWPSCAKYEKKEKN